MPGCMHVSLASWKCLLLVLEAAHLLGTFCRRASGFWDVTKEGWEPPPPPQGPCFSSCLGINAIDQMSMLELEGNLELVPSFSRWRYCHLWLLPLAFLSQQEEPGRWDFTILWGLGWAVWGLLSSGLWERKKGVVNPMLLSSRYFVRHVHFTPWIPAPGEDLQPMGSFTNPNHPLTGPFKKDTLLNDPFRLPQKKGWGQIGRRDS